MTGYKMCHLTKPIYNHKNRITTPSLPRQT
jgi:hypothetical protein